MSRIKFNHVFAALLVISALCAFVIPQRYTTKAQPQVQSLFYPVAKPVRSMAGWVHERFSVKRETKDQRDVKTLLGEIDQLQQEVTALSSTVEELLLRDAERKRVGPIRERCTPFAVVGPAPDNGGREGLLIRGSTLEGLRQGQAVLFGGEIVGRIDEPPGLAGAQVRLVTDRGFRVGAYFVRFVTGVGPERIDTPPALIEGLGRGAMRCATDIPMKQVENLRVDDWVVLDDKDWDAGVQDRRLGRVVYVAPKTSDPRLADIRIEPSAKLLRLPEVMVVTK